MSGDEGKSTPVDNPKTSPAANGGAEPKHGDEDKAFKVISDLSVSLKGLNTRQLPTWDHNTKKRESIKEHLQMAKQLGRRLEWSDKELANEVMLSLRGESRTAARNFSEEIQNDFKLLEQELLKYFWVPKPKSQMMKEFNNLSWNVERQTLLQYGVTLRSKLMKIFRGDTEEFNLKLRDRFIEGIKEMRPEFGRSFEMLDLDSKADFMELATYAQMKYDIYRINTERIEEDQAFLTKEYNNEKKKGKTNVNNQGAADGQKGRNAEAANQMNDMETRNFNPNPRNWNRAEQRNRFNDYNQGPGFVDDFGPTMRHFHQYQPNFRQQKPINWHFRQQHWGRRPNQYGFEEWKDQRFQARFDQNRGNNERWQNGYNWGGEQTARYPYFNPGYQGNRQQGAWQRNPQRGYQPNFNNHHERNRDNRAIKGSMVRKHDKTEYLESQEESKNL